METALSPCGMDCVTCEEYKKSCAGCREIKGEVFWVEYIGKKICPMYDCPVNERKLKHCGECDELPCQIYYSCKDPSVSDEEHKSSIDERATILKGLK